MWKDLKQTLLYALLIIQFHNFLGLNAFEYVYVINRLTSGLMKISVQDLMQQFESLNFNPEFSQSYTKQIFNAWQHRE